MRMQNIKLDDVVDGYIECALWSSVDEEGNPLDDNAYDTDVAESTYESFKEDCIKFITENQLDLHESKLSDDLIGHNFWLTRNGHGRGFWDHGLGLVGDKLTKASKVYGEVYLYIGDDGLVYSD